MNTYSINFQTEDLLETSYHFDASSFEEAKTFVAEALKDAEKANPTVKFVRAYIVNEDEPELNSVKVAI